MSNGGFPVSVPQRQPLGHFQQKDHFWAFQTKPRVVAFPNFWLFFFFFLEKKISVFHCKCSMSSTSAIFISKTRANGLSHHSSCRSILLFLIFFFFAEISRINVSCHGLRGLNFSPKWQAIAHTNLYYHLSIQFFSLACGGLQTFYILNT